MSILRETDPELFEDLIERGAAALRTGEPVQKRYSTKTGFSKSWTSRQYNGSEFGPATRYLSTLAQAGVNAVPLAVEGLATALETRIGPLTQAALETAIAGLDEAEHDLDSSEDRAVMHAAVNPTPEMLLAAADADVRYAQLALERAAHRRRLARLKRVR